MLDQITPVVLTYNEAPNIGRTLGRLAWARDVVVVDSGSTDATAEIVRGFPSARLFVRPFDDHERQWTYGQKETGIRTEWMMRLDADYVLSEELIAEIGALRPAPEIAAYRTRFVYCIHGRPLRTSLYPPRPRLFRVSRGRFWQDGHTDEVAIDGAVADLSAPIYHDDRKPLRHWIVSQARYMELEAGKLADAEFGTLGLADRLRRDTWVTPFLVFFYALLARGLILDGRAGIHYCFQRTAAEFLLKLYLLDREMAAQAK